MIETNCYSVSHTQGLLMIGLSFVKDVSTFKLQLMQYRSCPGNFFRSKIGR
jgi:hypothetical protein